MSSGIPFGNYRLLRRIARGGMAEVFLAAQRGPEGFERTVAVKRILPHLADQTQFVDMFMDEARLAARLSHPNIAHIYEWGRVEDAYFIAMEYIDGIDLSAVILDTKTLIPLEHAARVAADVCGGLHYAHAQKAPDGSPLGLVHRDISPQNILVSFDGVVKVVDFGIAKAAFHINRTQPGVVRGKYTYMSPEQVEGKPLDGRSDIFCLGIVLYEMCTGDALFPRTDALKAMRQIRAGQIPPPKRGDRPLPPGLERILRKALAKKPDDRYRTAGEMQMDLEEYLRSTTLISTSIRLGEYITERYRKYRPEVLITPPSPERKAPGTVQVDFPKTPGGTRPVAPSPPTPSQPSAPGGTPSDPLAEPFHSSDERTLGPMDLLQPESAERSVPTQVSGVIQGRLPPRPATDRPMRVPLASGPTGMPALPASALEAISGSSTVVDEHPPLSLDRGMGPIADVESLDTVVEPRGEAETEDGNLELTLHHERSDPAPQPARGVRTGRAPRPALEDEEEEAETRMPVARHLHSAYTAARTPGAPTETRRPRGQKVAIIGTALGVLAIGGVLAGYWLAAPSEPAPTAGGTADTGPKASSGPRPGTGRSGSELAAIAPRPTGRQADAAAARKGTPIAPPRPAPEPTRGALRIHSTPLGARITVDGNELPGSSPLRYPVRPGTHSVLAELKGYESKEQQVTVLAGQVLPVHLVLERAVDNEPVISPVKRSATNGTAKKKRRKPRKTTKVAIRGMPPAESLEPEPARPPPPKVVETGFLSVTTIPWSRVSVDGKVIGDTPLANVKIPAGRHVVKLTNPERGTVSRVVHIQPGQTTKLRLNL